MAPRGRPKTKPKTVPRPRTAAEIRVRAHHIFRFSGGFAKPITIARQLEDEGYGEVDPKAIARWSKAELWDEKAVAIPTHEAMTLSEDIRQAVRMRLPDDMERIEQSANSLAHLSGELADHITTQIPNIVISTPQDLESVMRAMGELVKVHFAVGKSVADLRLLRASSNFGVGEIIPPEKPSVPNAQPQQPSGDLDTVLSNFG